MAAEEHRIKKGLIVYSKGEGSTILDIQGVSGQMFSVTDNLEGLIHAVFDASGIPIFQVFSDNRVTAGTFGAEAIKIAGSLIELPNVPTGTGDVLTLSSDNVIRRSSIGDLIDEGGASVPLATATVDGIRKIFDDTVQTVASNAVSSVSDRTYGVQVNSSGQMVVNVPWQGTDPGQLEGFVLKTGDTMTGALTINVPTLYPLVLGSSTVNQGEIGIQFRGNTFTGPQIGYLTANHLDAASPSGYGYSFHFGSTETNTAVIIDGSGDYFVGTDKLVRESRTLTGGDGILIGGESTAQDLSANRVLTVDSTVGRRQFVGNVDTTTPWRTYVLICRLDATTNRKFAGRLFGARRSGNSASAFIHLSVSDTSTAGNVSYTLRYDAIQQVNTVRMVSCETGGQTWMALELDTAEFNVYNATGIWADIDFITDGIVLQTRNNSQVSSVTAYNSHHINRFVFDGTITTTSDGNSIQWNTAFGWGDHALAGYLTTVPLATTTSTGGVRLGVQAAAATVNAATTTAGRFYPVGATVNGNLYVNVPWVDTDTTYSEISEAESDSTTSSVVRLITGRRLNSWANRRGLTVAAISNWNTAYGWGDFRDFGLGTQAPTSLNYAGVVSGSETGFFRVSETVPNTSFPFMHIARSASIWGQVLFGNDELFFRTSTTASTNPFREVFHTGNLLRVVPSAETGAVRYNGTVRAEGQFYGGTSNPIHTARLNYSGQFWSTAFRVPSTGTIGTGPAGGNIEFTTNTTVRGLNQISFGESGTSNEWVRITSTQILTNGTTLNFASTSNNKTIQTGGSTNLVLAPGGNVLVNNTGGILGGGKLQVNGDINTTGGVRTGNPQGTTTDFWRLGRALAEGSSSPNRWIRVQIGNDYYDLLARFIGTVGVV